MIFMKNPMFGTGKYVVMDSGSFLLKGLVGILVHGVYGKTVTKKKDIGPSTEGETPLSHASETSILGMYILFLVMWMGTSKRYSV